MSIEGPGHQALDVGASAQLEKSFTGDEVLAFSEMSLDTNKVHIDSNYAATTSFKKPVVHGILTASLISAVLGTRLPGPGTILLDQSLKFNAPVYPGDRITATVTLTEKLPRNRYKLSATCTNQDGTVVLEGESTVLYRVP